LNDCPSLPTTAPFHSNSLSHNVWSYRYIYIYTDKTTLKCDKEFDGKGVGAGREKEKRGGEDG